ncbi:MAG: lytic transglycosylase domain-containing protein [Pyrinomonadaceae bacterium]
MKKSYLLTSMWVVVLAASTFAQDRQRYFDSFNTAANAEVRSTPASETLGQTSDRSMKQGAPKHYIPSPPTGESTKRPIATATGVLPARLIKRTALVTAGGNGWYAESSAESSAAAPVSSNRQSMTAGTRLRGYSTGDEMIDAFIVDSSRRHRIDPLLIYAQMGQESSFKRRATSNKGARGLMQLMPFTAKRMGVTDIYDPQQNIEGGVKYMRLLLDMFSGDINLALAGYNAGEGAVIKYGYQIPPYAETQNYVRRISARYRSITQTALSQMSSRRLVSP